VSIWRGKKRLPFVLYPSVHARVVHVLFVRDPPLLIVLAGAALWLPTILQMHAHMTILIHSFIGIIGQRGNKEIVGIA
jgi:hypothetical protein